MRRGPQGMGFSKLLAEGGIRHTNSEFHKGLFDRIQVQSYGKVLKKKVYKNWRGQGRETLYFYSFIYLFVYI